MMIIGLDPHPASHTVAALDEHGSTLQTLRVENTLAGQQELHLFAAQFPEHVWAIEGASNRCILPFVMALLHKGEIIHHIPPSLTSQYRARHTRKKTDVIDAENAARALRANPNLPRFFSSESLQEFQSLSRLQRALSQQRQGHALLLATLPQSSLAHQTLKHVLDALDLQLAALTKALSRLIKSTIPELLQVPGVGPVLAGVLIAEVGWIGRFPSPHHFASDCGAAPVERGSGANRYIRLNRGGNRRLNWALHMVALMRCRCDERTRTFVAQRRACGKTKRETLRILKTYIARELFRVFKAAQPPTSPTLPA